MGPHDAALASRRGLDPPTEVGAEERPCTGAADPAWLPGPSGSCPDLDCCYRSTCPPEDWERANITPRTHRPPWPHPLFFLPTHPQAPSLLSRGHGGRRQQLQAGWPSLTLHPTPQLGPERDLETGCEGPSSGANEVPSSHRDKQTWCVSLGPVLWFLPSPWVSGVFFPSTEARAHPGFSRGARSSGDSVSSSGL